jgi:hypothetical protein
MLAQTRKGYTRRSLWEIAAGRRQERGESKQAKAWFSLDRCCPTALLAAAAMVTRGRDEGPNPTRDVLYVTETHPQAGPFRRAMFTYCPPTCTCNVYYPPARNALWLHVEGDTRHKDDFGLIKTIWGNCAAKCKFGYCNSYTVGGRCRRACCERMTHHRDRSRSILGHATPPDTNTSFLLAGFVVDKSASQVLAMAT